MQPTRYDQAKLIECLKAREGTPWTYQELAAELTAHNQENGRPGVTVTAVTLAKAVQRLRERGMIVETYPHFKRAAVLQARVRVLEQENAQLRAMLGAVDARSRRAG